MDDAMYLSIVIGLVILVAIFTPIFLVTVVHRMVVDSRERRRARRAAELASSGGYRR